MQNHVWISLALVCFFSRVICNSNNGCSNRKVEIADKKLLLRLNWDNVTKPETLTAKSPNHCVQLCCEKNGSCNLAEFNSSEPTDNCIHVNCHRISECLVEKLDKSNGATTTYQLVEIESINVSTEQSKTSQIASRSIKSRKGVGETITTPNASSEKQTTITTDVPTVTQSDGPESTTSNEMSTAQPLDNNNATVSISTVIDGTVEATPIEDSTIKTNFPDLDADKKKHAVPRKGASDDRLWTPYSTAASPLQPMDQQPRPPIPTKQIQPNNQSSSRVRNATEFSTTEVSQIADHPNVTSTIHENLPEDYEKSSATATFLPDASQKEPKPKPAKNVILQATPSKPPPVKLVLSGSIDFLSSRTTIVAAQNLDDLHFQQSIYLIVSLIIGFLVLLLVVGMVLKHVYGVWERRHYQRMDFLIDGLYNSRPAV